MNATWLLKLYPDYWRSRYEPEFRALLEDGPMGFMDLFDIAFGAIDAHLRPQPGLQAGGGTPPSLPSPDPAGHARKRVRQLKYHFLHLALFCLLSVLLIVINLLAGREFYWAPIVIWALAMPLALHTMLLYTWRGAFGALAVPLAVVNAGLIGLNVFVDASNPWSIWTLSVSAIPVIGLGLVSFHITTSRRALAVSGGLIVALLGVASIFERSALHSAIFNAVIVVSLLFVAQQMRLGRWSLFQAHIFLFASVNLSLFALDIAVDTDMVGFQYVLAATVLLLAVHAMVRYGLVEFYDSSWEQAKIDQLSARIKESAITDSVQRNIFLTARIQRSFWMHLFFYVVLALDLTVINLLSGTDTPWMLWPIGIWAVAILTHAGYAYGPNRLLSANFMFWLGGSLGLFTIDAITENGRWWFWPVLGYGIVFLAHAGWVFIRPRWFGALIFAAISGSGLMVVADWQTSGGPWWYWPVLGAVVTVLLATPFALNIHRRIAGWESRKVSEITGK